MILRSTAILFAILLASTPSPSSAKMEEQNTCPQRIMVIQTVSGKPHEGWYDFGTKDEHPLIGVSFSYGPPDQKSLLTPSNESEKGKIATATWTFPESDTNYWVACEYAGTSAVVAKPLSKNISTCTVEYDQRFAAPVAKNWSCYSVTGTSN